MPRKRWLPLALSVVLSTACFHQVVQTGRSAGTTVVDKPFVPTWIFGLVAAPEIDVRAECPSGVAVIETEQSFVNGLVAVVTLFIFTPQHARITCSTSTASLPPHSIDLRLPAEATAQQSTEFVAHALARAEETGTPIVLHFQGQAQ